MAPAASHRQFAPAAPTTSWQGAARERAKCCTKQRYPTVTAVDSAGRLTLLAVPGKTIPVWDLLLRPAATGRQLEGCIPGVMGAGLTPRAPHGTGVSRVAKKRLLL